MDEKQNFFGDEATFESLANKYLSDDESKEQGRDEIEKPAEPISMPVAKHTADAKKSEIYFSNQFQPVSENQQPPLADLSVPIKKTTGRSVFSLSDEGYMDEETAAESELDPELERYRRRRENRRKYLKHNKYKLHLNIDTSKFTKNTYIFFAVVIALSAILSVYAVFCVNDLFALMKKDESLSVSVSESDIEDVDTVIDLLHDNKLVNCPVFCKIFVRVRSGMFVKTSKGPIEYTQGTFELNPKMGLEGLLVTLQGEVTEKETVQLTFPEGTTIPQMIDKLVKNDVCDIDALKAELEKATYTYSVLNDMSTDEYIPYKFEGYLFPDTYEFYEGENPNSVIEKLVKNLDEKFTQEMRVRAEELGMTIPEVLTLASIIQQEAADAQQMKLISGILHNRLNNPSTYPLLECNSTQDYINNKVASSLTATSPHTSDEYLTKYDTYVIAGLPLGPICNPGMDAIQAALYPQATDTFFFCHDSVGNMYTAKTLAEHNANIVRYNVNTTGK